MNRVLKLIHEEYALERKIRGQNVHVAILDTGAFPHAALEGRIVSFHDQLSGIPEPYDDNGHGTHIAGIIGGWLPRNNFQGVAPECLFHIYKVLNANGNGKVRSVIRAVEDIIRNRMTNRIRLINISVGMPGGPVCAEQKALLEIVDYAWSKGIVVVAAAGNNGPGENTVTYPGIDRKIITVGSSDDRFSKNRFGLKKGYSGTGPTEECIVKPEVLAPGTNIRSCGIQSPFAMSVKSGTSMAAPVVTGMLALLLSVAPDLTPAQVKMKVYEAVVEAKDNPNCWGYLYVDRLLQAAGR